MAAQTEACALPTQHSQRLRPGRLPVRIQEELISGDMPATEKNCGLPDISRIDLAVRWVNKRPDGLYLQSRYGVLRLSPVGSAIVRVTFTKGMQLAEETNPNIAVRRIEKSWKYKERKYHWK